MRLLTKSKYLAGLQCPRLLWTHFHEKEKLPEPDLATQRIMTQGTEVGEMATKLFPEGLNIPTNDFMGNIHRSKELLKENKPLFEAGFIFNQCFSRADILIPNNNSWDLIEVKSGTKVKEENLHDVAFQKYCYEGNGLKINKCYLMHINRDYIRQGELDLNKLFIKEDITEQVDLLASKVKENIEYMFEIINSKDLPNIKIGNHCSSPYKCPISECWDFLPENNVFHLYRGGKKSFELFEDGIELMSQIPSEFKLTGNQQIQRECDQNGNVHINKEKLKTFLDSLNKPLYYLDFETFSTAVPMFDGCRPYQQIPFQYSLHIVSKDKTEHYEYLYQGNGDPRKEFISSLKSVLGNSGTIIVYNQSFEIGRLKETAEFLPSYKEWVEETILRVVDLLIPFRNFWYYNPLQKGSASIKKVLPALVGKGYENMDISDGNTASVLYYLVTYEGLEGKEKVYADLLKYCGLDTEAMIWIVDELVNIYK